MPFARKSFCLAIFLALPVSLFSQTNYYGTNGTEYAIAGSLPGDQVFPDVALNSSGGFLVWQDNATDGSGWGISAERINGTLSGTLSPFRVNVTGANDQEHARVAMLNNGGAVFVWQGGVEGVNQRIYARFLNASNTFLTATDIVISSANTLQINPSVAVLNNGNVVIVWSSLNQAGSNSLFDVYAKILSPSGLTISNEFLVNQYTSYNQRTPSIASLKNGGFVVTWISEQEQRTNITAGASSMNSANVLISTTASVDVYARVYQSTGTPLTGEFLVNSDANPCANPAVAAASDGSFMITWAARDMVNYSSNNSWDIYSRAFSSNAMGGSVARINTYLPNSQYAPRITAIGLDYMIAWTSLGEDGSGAGVYGRFVHSDGVSISGEFRINTTTIGQQIHPVVAGDGTSQFLAVWTSFAGLSSGFDLFAQRYVSMADVLVPMDPPFVLSPFTLSNNVYQPQLVVSWPLLQGISVSNYQVFVDGAASPMGIVPAMSNSWTMTAANGLTTNSTHSFAINYVTTVGGVAPLSPSASGSTWSGQSWGGIPFEWMQYFYGQLSVSFDGNGNIVYNWPSPNAPVASGGPTLLQVFFTGGNPKDSSTWLQQKLVQTSQGILLTWNTQPGLIYQVQQSTNFNAGVWSNFGPPRFAHTTSDSVYVGGASGGFYRVQLMR